MGPQTIHRKTGVERSLCERSEQCEKKKNSHPPREKLLGYFWDEPHSWIVMPNGQCNPHSSTNHQLYRRINPQSLMLKMAIKFNDEKIINQWR